MSKTHTMKVEASVIEKARGGHADAFDQIIRAYQRRVLGTIFRILGRPEEVEDVGQDVFVRMFRSLGQLRAAEVFEPWLHRLTINTAYDHLRKCRRRRENAISSLGEEEMRIIEAAASGQSFEEDQRRDELREVVTLLLDKVRPDDRVLLVLKEIEGLSLSELEEFYGVSQNALKVRLFRARKRALRILERMNEPDEAVNRGGPARETAIHQLALATE